MEQPALLPKRPQSVRTPDRTAPSRHPLECPGPALHPHGWAGAGATPEIRALGAPSHKHSTPEDRDRVHRRSLGRATWS
jgi:hypothetical protein